MEARVAELEAQLLEAQAKAEATAINAEHAGQAMERRYTALAEAQGKLAGEREKLLAENAKLVQELQAAKAENNRLQAVVFEKDAIIQRKDVEIEALHADKRTLAKLLEQREAEVDEAHSRHRQSLDKIVVLSNANASLDADAHEARAAKNRLEHDIRKTEQHVQDLEKHNNWLEEEVARKIEYAQQERHKVSTQVVQLQQTISEAEDKVQQLERSERRLKERVAELERSAEIAQQSLKSAKDEGNSKEHIFCKELATAQKLYTLYKDASEERSRKVTELEGIIHELQKHLEEAEAAQRDVLERAEERVLAAEQEAAAEREQRCRVMEAAANGNLPFVSSPGNAPVSPNGETFSHTELYMKYVEATTQCRQERLAKRQIEIMLEQVMGEIEAKSEIVREQGREYSRVQAAHEQIAASLAIAQSENRQYATRITQLEAEGCRETNNRRVLEQQIRDLGQQVTVLLNQVQTLQGGRADRPAIASTPSQSSAVITSDDIISERLLSFQDIQGLQQKNMELLTVVRKLSAEKDQERALLEQEKAKDREALEAEKNALYAERVKQQELFEQIVRQRDMFKKLFQDASSTHGTPQASDGVRLMLPAPRATPDSNGHAQDEPDYKVMHRDLEKELEHVRKEGEEHSRLLNQESAKAKEAASAARAEAARMRNEAEYERGRGQRLQDQLCDLHLQVEGLTQSNTKYQVLVIEMQQRLSNAETELGTQRDKARQAEARAHLLENEKALLSAAEERLKRMVDGLSTEKHKLAAQLKIEQKASVDKEAEYVAERGRLTSEAARLQSDLALAQKESADRERHLKAAALESEAEAQRAENKAKLAEEATQNLRNEAAQSSQRASSAEVKVEVLQKAVQQAEERVATLEMQMQSRSGMLEEGAGEAGGQAPAGSREADLTNQVKHLREELTSAQETAAAATGHAKQYEMLAKSSDEAVKVMQEQLEKCKADYEERIIAIRKETQDLQGHMAELETGRTEAQQHLQAAARAVEDANRQAASREAELKAQLTEKDKDKQQLNTRLRRQDEDIKQLRSQCRSVQTNYDHQVVEHAAAVNKLNALDVAYKSASDRLRQQEDAVAQAHREKMNAEAELNRQRLLLEERVQAAEGKLREVEEQNRLLHGELTRMADQRASTEGAAADGGSGNLAQVVAYLRQRGDILSAELESEKHAVSRLRSELQSARRKANEASAQMASQAERARQSARTEEEHAALMQKVEHLNLLRDSNDKLRSDSDRLRQEVAKLKQRAEQAEKAVEPLRKRIHELSAQVESHADEMRVVNDNAEDWKRRAQQLQQKYGKVDLAEHQRVQEALANAQAQLAQLRSTSDTSIAVLQADLEKVKADHEAAKRQTQVAKKHIYGVYNPGKVSIDAWKAQQANMQQKLAQLEESAAEATQVKEEIKKLQAENADLKGKLAQAQKESENAKNDLKNVEGRQQHDKQLSINAVQAERRRQDAEKANLQNALEEAKSTAAASEGRVRELAQKVGQLQGDVNAARAKAAVLEKDLAACRAESNKPDKEDGESIKEPGPGPEMAAAPPGEPDTVITEAAAVAVAPASPAQPAADAAPASTMMPPAEAIMPGSPPAPVRPTIPSPLIPAADTPMLPTGSGAPSLQDQLRATLLAKRRLSPVPEPAKPSADEEPKRDADAVEQPVTKRARTTSESNTAAQAQAESFLASLEESSAAAVAGAEEVDVDTELYEHEQGDEEQHEEEYEGQYEEEGDGDEEAEAEDHDGEGEDAEQSAMEQEHDNTAEEAEDMMEDYAEAEEGDAKVPEEDMADAVEGDVQEPDQADKSDVHAEASVPEPVEFGALVKEEPQEEGEQVQHEDGGGSDETEQLAAEQPAQEQGAANQDRADGKDGDRAEKSEEQDPSREGPKVLKAAGEGQADGTATRPSRKKAPIKWEAQATAAVTRPAAPSLSAAALPYTPKPGRSSILARGLTLGRGGPGRLPYSPTTGRLPGRGGQSVVGGLQQRGGRTRGRGTGTRGRRQPGAPEGQPPAGQQ